MEYSKPKVTIDLEEYNALLKAKSEKYDPDDVASIAATLMMHSTDKMTDINYLTDALCRDLDYTIVLNTVAGNRGIRVEAKVIKKPIR